MANKLVKKDATYNLIITQELEDKIRYMCNRFPNNEWSGVLFYTYTGSFKDNNLQLTAVDFYLMDYGSATYTEFDMSPDICTYMCDNNLLDCQQALIHSHDTMATFFSNTDTDTLLQEGSNRNSFLSLIVNNAGNYTAAITRSITHSQTIHDTVEYTDFDTLLPSNDNEVYDISYKEIEYYMLNISKPNKDHSEIDKRIDEIKSAKTIKNNSFTSTVGQTRTLFNEDDNYWNTYNVNSKYNKQNTKGINTYNKEYNDYEDTPKFLDEYKVNKYKVNKMLKQIIMGSTIAIPKDDIKTWIPKVVISLDNTFKDIKLYDNFIEAFIESIFTTIDDENLTIVDIDTRNSVYAYNMIEILEAEGMPSTKYTKAIIKALELYVSY